MKNKIINTIDWINNRCAEACLLFVFLFSLYPFIANDDNTRCLFYVVLAAILSFASVFFLRSQVKSGLKVSTTYNIMGILTALIAVISFFLFDNIKYRDLKLCLSVYIGAAAGLMAGALVEDTIENSKRQEEKRLKLKKQKDAEIEFGKWLAKNHFIAYYTNQAYKDNKYFTIDELHEEFLKQKNK